jgi:hypothetical protein
VHPHGGALAIVFPASMVVMNINMASLVADYSSSGESDDDVDSDSVPEL